MGKGNATRRSDTIAYIRNIADDQATEMDARLGLLPQTRRDAILNAMSLGSSGSWRSERVRDHDLREAKRATILAAGVFIKDQTQSTAEMARLKLLAESEMQFKQRLDSWFCKHDVTGKQVADNAVAIRDTMPNWDNQSIKPYAVVQGGVFDMVRGRAGTRPFNCYNGVVYWAFQGAAISLRWLWNYWKAGNGNAPNEYPIFLTIDDAAADNTRLDVVDQWRVDTTKPEREVLGPDGIQKVRLKEYEHNVDGIDNGHYRVAAGLTVILPNPFNKFGHTVLSTGDGMCISQNTMVAGNDFTAMKQQFPNDAAEWDRAPQARNHVVSLASLRDGGFFGYKKGYNTMFATKVPFWENIPLAER